MMILQTISLPKMSVNANSSSSYTMILILSVLLLAKISFAEGEVTEESVTSDAHTENEVHPSHAVLYPSFVVTLGAMVYYLLSRYLHWLPYTAVMFILGVIMGLVASTEQLLIPSKHENYLHDTLFAWQGIDSEVLLLVFLPGLIFKDALGQNPHLFALGFGQLFIFAFPLVLAGTYLTAYVGFYVLPYEWPFFLCLTFGSILSATDPAAVSALLEEVGMSQTDISRPTSSIRWNYHYVHSNHQAYKLSFFYVMIICSILSRRASSSNNSYCRREFIKRWGCHSLLLYFFGYIF